MKVAGVYRFYRALARVGRLARYKPWDRLQFGKAGIGDIDWIIDVLIRFVKAN